MKIFLHAIFIGFIVASFAICRIAEATLGEHAESVASDRKALSAVSGTTTVRDVYTIQEVKSESVTMREYISPEGVVFGIAWNGLVHPDLAPLLGSYAGEYKEALKHTPRQWGRRSTTIKAPGVVVEKWGHMRNLQGRAFAPALIPPGVSIDEIK